MTDRPKTPTLDLVSLPADLKRLTDRQLRNLADELRAETISAVSVTGGHLGAGLGVVELTVALHAVFDAPRDKIIWDVGHQCYPHKILTGRRERIRTLRMEGGLSGFTKRSDPFRGQVLHHACGWPLHVCFLGHYRNDPQASPSPILEAQQYATELARPMLMTLSFGLPFLIAT